MKLVRSVLRILGSYGLSVSILFLMFVVTLLGTLAQEHDGLFRAQEKYFASWFFQAWELDGAIGLYLPGGMALMVALAANLLIGGMVRVRWNKARIGVLITHVGIAMLLIAGYVKLVFAHEGSVALYEGESAREFQSYHDWEILIEEERQDARRRFTVHEVNFEDARPGAPALLEHPELPFRLEVEQFMRNCRALPKGPMFEVDVPVVDGYFLQERPLEKEHERNVPGAYVTITAPGAAPQHGILSGLARFPLTVQADGRRFGLELRRQHFPLPFEIRLDEFTHEFHPGTSMAREYMSDVTVFDGPVPQPVKIRMNEPLRRDGLVAFQSSYGPSDARPGDRMFSVFAVVRNPSDQWPLYACIVISVGMLVHFGRKLLRHVKKEVSA